MKKLYSLLLLTFFALPFFANVPEVSTRLTEDYPIEMPSLKAYPIYINASVDAPDAIDFVEITIDGQIHTAESSTDYFYFLWTPSSYGIHEISIKAKTVAGDENTITKNITVTDISSSQTVTSLQDVVIEFGGENSRWYYGYYTFPQFVGAYNNIMSSLEVECPPVSGGCDDWDRYAQIDVKAPDGNWIQIIRYITPYGVACNHGLDVTDYMSLLQGEVEMRVFIDTWGTGGWQFTLDFDYQQGAPQYLYSNVVEVWDDTYNFGDPANLQPVETFSVTIPSGVAESYLRLSNTGHGWGQNNSSNAAEFFNATHYLDIDGVETYSQNLFNSCNPNPDGCQPQNGTWYYGRAGWCPGAISPPDIFDFLPYVGTTFNLDYRFHPTYQDLCHPNNPNCISGTTCPDCNDGYNPHYFVDGQIINKSNNPIIYGDILNTPAIDNTEIYNLVLYPNPSNGYFNIKANIPDFNTRLSIHTIDGKQVKTYYFSSSEALNKYTFDVSNLPKGAYFINLENKKGTGALKFVIN